MPLLRREPFVRQKPPRNVGPDDELFLCKLTGEVFTDYEKFFECTILCNSLVWTCSLTGRPGLTFQEAVDCERKARQQLESFPLYFQRPLLLLAALTHRSRLNDLNDDLFQFFKDRYFIGEVVDAVVDGEKKSCKVSNVLPPEGAMTQSKEGAGVKSNSNGMLTDDSDSDVICLDDEPAQSTSKITAPTDAACSATDKLAVYGSDPSKYQYVLEEVKHCNIYILAAQCIGRKKGVVSRDKCKLFLKHHCAASPDGIWRVKERSIALFALSTLTLDSVFAGPGPQFGRSEPKRKPIGSPAAPRLAGSHSGSGGVIDLTDDDVTPKASKTSKPRSSSKHSAGIKNSNKKSEKGHAEQSRKVAASATHPKVPLHATPVTPSSKHAAPVTHQSPSDADFQRIKREMAARAQLKEAERMSKVDRREELRRRAEDERLRHKAERELEREKQREEKRKAEEVKRRAEEEARVWSRPRDDLECDDLKDLPVPTPVDCLVPVEMFGDAVAVLEFLTCFSSLFELTLPDDISLDALGRALIDCDADGLYADIVRQLLEAIFRLQDERSSDDSDTRGVGDAGDECDDVSLRELLKEAGQAALYPTQTYGTPLRQLQLDSFSLTEILRLHFLSSGAMSRASAKFDYQRRGGFQPRDDAGLDFRRQEPGLVRALGETSVFDLSPGDKLKVAGVLIQQLLTHAATRDFIEDNFDRLRQAQKDLRNHQANGHKRDRDEAFYWVKKKMEAGDKGGNGTGVNGCVNGSATLDGTPSSSGAKGADDEASATGSRKLAKRGVAKAREPTDRDYEMMPTENLDWEKISGEDRARLRAWQARREAELTELALELQRGGAGAPLGRDRAFRRYWVFRSVPGLFVEDCADGEALDGCFEEFLAMALPAGGADGRRSTESCKENVPGRIVEELGRNGVEEETEIVANASKVVVLKPSGGDKTDTVHSGNESQMPVVNGDQTVVNSDQKVDSSAIHFVSTREQILSRGSMRWAFFSLEGELEGLVGALNPRGHREGPLRTAILEHKQRLVCWMGQCDPGTLASRKYVATATAGVGKGAEKKGKGGAKAGGAVAKTKFFTGQDCLEGNMRDLLLDLEERVYTGSLGALKTVDRVAWRESLESGNYCSLMTNGRISPDQADDADQKSSPGGEDCPRGGVGGMKVPPAVRGLARALLQVQQMIDPRYLGTPLGSSDADKKKKANKKGSKSVAANKSQASSSSDEDEEGCGSAARGRASVQERWRQSLLSSPSLSQLHVLLSVLDASVAWSKSALLARCRICRRKGDGERMLLCDGCDRGHHMYCLKPPVKHVPVGDWFCPDCRPKEVVYTPRKNRKSFSEQVSDDDETAASHSSEADQSEASEDASETEEMETEDVTLVHDTSQSESESLEVTEGEEEEEDDEEEQEVRGPAKIRFTKTPKKSATEVKTKQEQMSKTKASDARRNILDAESTTYSRASHSRDNSPATMAISKIPEKAKVERTLRASKRPPSVEPPEEEEEEEEEYVPSRRSRNSAAAGRGDVKRGRYSLDTTAAAKSRAGLTNGDTSAATLRARPVELTSLRTRHADPALTSTLRLCEELVSELMQREEAWPFLKPVLKRDALDYFDIVARPMDLTTIKNKLSRLEYAEPGGAVLDDVRLIFHNCRLYNMPIAPVYAAGQKLERFFEKRLRELKLNTKALIGGSPAVTGGAAAKGGRKRTL